jgi:dimethylargininase
VSHIDRQPIDPELALRQWHEYVAALRGAGWQTMEVPPADDCPDAVFVEDAVVVYGDLAVITRPGATSRRGETAAVENVVRDFGYRVAHIEAPGTLDGGDVLKHDGQVWVGVGDRTNEAGVEQLRDLLAQFGATTVGVPVSSVLHLKSAVTALPDGTVIGYPPLVDTPAAFPVFEPVGEEPGSHVVLLGGRTLLMAASAEATAVEFRRRGYHVFTVDISEYEKLEGCVTCLSVRLRGVSPR